jgi:hypothetical protein
VRAALDLKRERPSADAGPGTDSKARRRRLITAAAAIVAVLAILTLLVEVRWHNHQPYSGDEPHYLVMTNSLIQDGDFDVKNDYMSGRFLRYYPYAIDAHVNPTIFTTSRPHWYPEHGVGLAVLLAPAVGIADTSGARAAMVVVALIVIALAFLWARRFTGGVYAAIAVAALAFSPAFLGMEGRIFPDLATAALLLGCLLIMETRRRRDWHLALLGVLVGAAPWFHYKNVVAFGTVAAIVFVQVARGTEGSERIRRLALLAGPAVASLVAYEVVIRTWYGSWLPTHMVPPTLHIFALSEERGIAAASFDAARGLFTNDPALLLILAGLPLWLARFRGSFLRVAWALGPTILVQATFSDWSGGLGPPGRYALDFAPALVPAIALVLREARGAFRVIAGALLALTWALAAAFVWLHPQWGFTGFRSPFFAAVDDRVGPALDRTMPTFDFGGQLVRGGWQLAAWIAVSGLFVTYGVALSRRAVSARRAA